MSEAEQAWRRKTDDQLLAAAGCLADYTEEGEQLIRTELRRRGLPEPPPPIGECSECRRAVNVNHPADRCLQCEAPLPPELLEKLKHVEVPTAGPGAGSAVGAHRLDVVRGWLILPAIGLVISVVSRGWLILALALNLSLPAEQIPAPYRALFALGLIVELAVFTYLLYAATRFFNRKRNGPLTMVRLMVVNILAAGGLAAVELAAGAEALADAYSMQLGRSLVAALIWIPYFRRSKRVKATFVE